MRRMTVRIRLVASADGRPTDKDGMWLVSCDVDANDGRGEVMATPIEHLARTFESAAEALEYWRRPSTVHPTRPDGKPNRPLTAYTVSIEKVPDA